MEKEKENVWDMHMGKLVHMLSNQLKRRDSMEAGPSDLTHMQRLVLRRGSCNYLKRKVSFPGKAWNRMDA